MKTNYYNEVANKRRYIRKSLNRLNSYIERDLEDKDALWMWAFENEVKYLLEYLDKTMDEMSYIYVPSLN